MGKSLRQVRRVFVVIGSLAAAAPSFAALVADPHASGTNGEAKIAVAPADDEFANDVFSKKVAALAQHLALRTACPKLDAKGDFDYSTERWYLGDSLRQWAKTYAEQFRTQEEFPKRAFRKAFNKVIKEKHGHFLFTPSSAENLAGALADYLEIEHASLRKNPAVAAKASGYLVAKKSALAHVETALKAFNDKNEKLLTEDTKARENCKAERASPAFWEAPSFDPTGDYRKPHEAREVNGDRSLGDRIRDIKEKLAPSRKQGTRPPETSLPAGAKSRKGSQHGGIREGNPDVVPGEMGPFDLAPSLPASEPPSLEEKKDKLVNVNLPAVSDDEMKTKGYYRFGADDGHTYGTARTVWRIQEAGKMVAKKGIVLGIGEMSAEGGPTSGHAEHQSGNDIDMRMIMSDGVAAPSNTYGVGAGKRKYDLEKTWQAIKAMIDVDPKQVNKVFIEDPALRTRVKLYMRAVYKRSITVTGCNHYDHIHISYFD